METTTIPEAIMPHTPGPWMLSGDTVSGKDSSGMESPIAIVSHYWRDRRIDSANARLIAAAPELLAQLEAAVDVLETIPIPEEHKKVIGAHLRQYKFALAKAKGLV